MPLPDTDELMYQLEEAVSEAEENEKDAIRHRKFIAYLLSNNEHLDDMICACESKEEFDDLIDELM